MRIGFQAPCQHFTGPACAAARRRCCGRRCAAAGGAGGGALSGEDEAFQRRALQEAVDTLRRAQALAQQQARSELVQGWAADGGGPGHGSSGGNGDGWSSGASWAGRDAPAPAEAVAAFLVEQGLSARAAAAVAARIVTGGAAAGGSGSGVSACESGGGGGSGQGAGKAGSSAGGGGGLSMGQLQAKWLGLQRVLPDARLAEMVAREPRLVEAGSGDLVGAMVALVEAFPSRDVQAMVQGRPELLLMQPEDLRARCERVVGKLLQLHPSKDRDVIAGLIEENPELLLRMDYYMDARLLDDLPVEIQNMMIPPGDMGIGWLYRHYAKKRAGGS